MLDLYRYFINWFKQESSPNWILEMLNPPRTTHRQKESSEKVNVLIVWIFYILLIFLSFFIYFILFYTYCNKFMKQCTKESEIYLNEFAIIIFLIFYAPNDTNRN